MLAEEDLDALDVAVLREHHAPVLDLAADYKASYCGAIVHFLDRLEGGRAFETAPEDNLETLRIVESADRTGGFPDPELPTTSA